MSKEDLQNLLKQSEDLAKRSREKFNEAVSRMKKAHEKIQKAI